MNAGGASSAREAEMETVDYQAEQCKDGSAWEIAYMPGHVYQPRPERVLALRRGMKGDIGHGATRDMACSIGR